MKFLASNKKTLFLGQSVKYPGSSIFQSLINISNNKKIEMPVFEDVQMGISIGLALDGFIPITCFPRFDFLVLAFNQLINHADKLNQLTNNKFKSKIIVRTMVGSNKPLDAGCQHTQDHTEALKKMLKYSKIIKLNNYRKIFNEYKNALKSKKYNVFVFVEDGNEYI